MSAGIDFFIVVALEEERDAVLQRLPQLKELAPSSNDARVYYRGRLTPKQHFATPYEVVLMPVLHMEHRFKLFLTEVRPRIPARVWFEIQAENVDRYQYRYVEVVPPAPKEPPP